MADRREDAELGAALVRLVGVWMLLLAQPRLAPYAGRDAASLVCFAVAGAVVFTPPLPLLRPRAGRTALLALAAGAGLRTAAEALLPGDPIRTGAGLAAAIARIALAPLFEEGLYRERLLMPLQTRLGAPGAVVLTSALFALPHGAPEHVVQAFVLGLALAAARVGGGSLALCVGLHAGWNLAAWG